MTEPTHAAILVGKIPAADLNDALGAALAAFETPDLGRRTLADEADIAAVEHLISSAPAINIERAYASLQNEFDVAIVPLENRRKRLLVCDMDSTIIGQECLDELADFAGLKAEVSAITERAMRGELDFEGALTTRVAMLKGLDLKALEACYRERIRLNPGARALVETMKADGARCVLVSGGFTAFTARVCSAAGFHAHHANQLIDDGRALSGEVAQPILGRDAKLQRLESDAAALSLSAADALAIGDGANDLAMIEAAGLGLAYKAKPIVVDAADAAIQHTDLRAALFFQGYNASEIRA
ncbi:MAG: phosphoserine phosphatase SerB [Pseudomonadota bacterium]